MHLHLPFCFVLMFVNALCGVIPFFVVIVYAVFFVVVVFVFFFFFFQAEDGIRDGRVTGVQTCALPILPGGTLIQRCPRSAVTGTASSAASGCAAGSSRSTGSVPRSRRSTPSWTGSEIGRASCRERV